MNFKRYIEASDTWVDSHYIKKTDTDIITTLPATIYPLAQTVTLGLKGNTVQNGTPTPSNPVEVNGVGTLDNGQYKIPISSSNTTTPVYLGEVQTTRLVKKYEFTGNETFYISSQASVYYTTQISSDCNKTSTYNTGCIINAYKLRKQSTAANLLDGEFTIDANGYLWFRNYDYATLADFRTYLAAQYAAGTPVTVWYVLATETTGIVNEPLMKIGNYADSISGISIPTTAGANTLDVDTTVKPSEVSAAFNGWHPVSSAHERSGGAWT